MALSFMQITTFIIIYLLFIRTSSSVLLSHDEECLALLEFKQSFLHQRPYALFHVGGSQKLDSWKKTYSSNKSDHVSDCCLWDGVACSYNHHVIGLNLSQSSLHGSLHPNTSLFNLVHLQMLDLSMNNFVHSQIPYGIARLKQLRYLNLRKSSLSGQIPDEISHLTQLRYLVLSWNSLELGTSTLEFLLQNMTRLEQLLLTGVDIGSSVPPFFANVSSLEVISLSGCGLQGKFPSRIFHLPKLKAVDVGANPILSGFIPEFQNNSLLEVLSLARTSFAGKIPKSIGKLNHLETISLIDSYISGCIPTSLYNMTRLTHLALGQSEEMGLDPSFPPNPPSIGLEVCDKRIMCDWFSKLSRLETLGLSGVEIGSSVPPFFANVSSLEVIALFDCGLRGEFPSGIFHLPKLKVVDVGANPILSGFIPEFQNNSLLEFLSLAGTSFAGKIPKSIGKLNHLETISLIDSYISGCIPTSLYNMTRLTHLALGQSEEMGLDPSFPPNPPSIGLEVCDKRIMCDWFSKLSRLETLGLSGVEIGSSVPPFFANVSSLEVIALFDCGLRGEFPSGIFHLPKLKVVDVGANPILSGFIPEFQNNSLLEFLSLAGTSFAGKIPKSIGKLNHLETISLIDSYISGCIPTSLYNMTRLTYLALGQSEEMVDPSFPLDPQTIGLEVCDKRIMRDWVSKLYRLEALIMVGVKIKDEILPSLANLNKLRYIQMRESLIFGHIPSSFMNLTQLTHIDLARNQLQGQIPNLFSSFKCLEDLDLSVNKFSGRVDLNTFIGLTSKLHTLHLGENIGLSFITTDNHNNLTLIPDFLVLDLSSCNLREFPIFLRFQKKLEFLFLFNNQIKGLIPEWMWNVSKETLKGLDLSENFITGFHQHPQILPWVRLEHFHIDHNQLQGRLPIPPPTTNFYSISNNDLTGKIPPLICEAKSLVFLDLSSNNLTGTLPPCLGILSNLLVLDLKRNNFHGPMMNAFMHGCPMKRIDLSHNQFTGHLSKSLANCSDLELLAVGGNAFKDIFPFWLGYLAKFQVLILRSNHFFGSIQDLTTNRLMEWLDSGRQPPNPSTICFPFC